jgi:hypothetical protein
MLHILFVILKILAIIIASILGLLLFLLLIVMFVPIRYRADVRKYDEIVVKARANWLLRIVFVRVWFINQQLHLKLRVFGICIYDNLRPKKDKKPKKSSPDLKEKRFKKKEKKEKIEKKQENSTSLKIDQKADNIVSLKVDQKAITQKTETIVKENKNQVEEMTTQIEKIKTQVEETKTNVEEEKTQVIETTTQVENATSQDKEPKIHVINSNSKIEVSKIQIEVSQQSEDSPEEAREPLVESIDSDQTLSETKKSGVFSKIKAFFGKLKTIILKIFGLGGKIKGIVATVKDKLKNLSDLIKGLWEKKNKIIAFLKNEINKDGIKMAFRQVIKALKHCAPRKIIGYLRYGTGDPCSTGEAFAAAAFFYGKYGNSLKLVPDFEEEVLEGEVMVKGRIRIFTLLIIGIKLIRDKNFRQLLKNAKQLKEEL